MTSTCISNCVKDARVPVRATYVNLYKWPESDVEFIRSLSSDKRKTSCGAGQHHFLPHPKVVDSISCRQLYLRSYTFSRDDDEKCKDDKKEKKKESSRNNSRRSIRDSVASETTRKRSRRKRRRRENEKSSSESGDFNDNKNGGSGRSRRRRRKCEGLRRAKEASCAALAAIFRRLLYCTAEIDVVR